MRRIRKCKDCSKPLAGTLVRCHECGGEQPDGDMTDVWGVAWKLDLGVKPEKIFNHHDREAWNNR